MFALRLVDAHHPAPVYPSASCPPREKQRLRGVRPSILDLRFTGDPWITRNEEGCAHLWLGNCCLVVIQTAPVDLPAMNQALGRLRQRRRCHPPTS